MAERGRQAPIWEEKNEAEQDFLQEREDLMEVYRKCRGLFGRYFNFYRALSHLHSLGVIDSFDEEDITECHKSPSHKSSQKLLGHIYRGQAWQFHAMIRACVLSGQRCLIERLGLQLRNYMTEEEKAHVQQSSPTVSIESTEGHQDNGIGTSTKFFDSSQRKAHPERMESQPNLSPRIVQAIGLHAKVCIRRLMRRNLYDFGDHPVAKTINTAKSYISIKAEQEIDLGKLQEISEHEYMVAIPGLGSPCIIRMYGQPGMGKSTTARHIVYQWSCDMLNHLSNDGPSPTFNVMLFIQARDIRTTVDDAIRAHLFCDEEDKQLVYELMQSRKVAAIVLDAVDEVRDGSVLQEIQKFLSKRQSVETGPVIFVTSRTDLCALESQVFDRFLYAKGFTVAQGYQYIDLYLPAELSHKVLPYSKARQKELYPILTNPLFLHIYCTLILEKRLVLDKDQDLSITRMFSLLIECVLSREGVKVIEEELHNIYRLCLYGLLLGWREFSQSDLNEFDIGQGYYVLFIRSECLGPSGPEISFSFPHEMIWEYFSGKCIASMSVESMKALILCISSKVNLRNVQKLIFSMLLQVDSKQHLMLLVLMLRAILIFQYEPIEEAEPEHSCWHRVSLLGRLRSLSDGLMPLDQVARDLKQSDIHVKGIKSRYKTITKAFQSGFLKKNRWYEGLGQGVFEHVTECLSMCQEELRKDLTKKTTDHLLPCRFTDKSGYRHFVSSVDITRWAEVFWKSSKEGAVQMLIKAWCTPDAHEAINSFYKQEDSCLILPNIHRLELQMDRYTEVWGQLQNKESYEELAHLADEVDKLGGPKTHKFSLDIYLVETAPLHGLHDFNWPNYQPAFISISGGTILLSELYSMAIQKKLEYIFLNNPTVIIGSEIAMDIAKGMRNISMELYTEAILNNNLHEIGLATSGVENILLANEYYEYTTAEIRHASKGRPKFASSALKIKFVDQLGKEFVWDDGW